MYKENGKRVLDILLINEGEKFLTPHYHIRYLEGNGIWTSFS